MIDLEVLLGRREGTDYVQPARGRRRANAAIARFISSKPPFLKVVIVCHTLSWYPSTDFLLQ